MPRILTAAASNLTHLIPNKGVDTHALTNLLTSLDGPPDMLGLDSVVFNAAMCIRAFLNESGVTKLELHDYAKSLEMISEAIVNSEMVNQPFATAGRATRYRQWALLHGVSPQWRPLVLAGIGAELVRAHLLQQTVPPVRAHQILRLSRDHGTNEACDTLARKSINDTMMIVDSMSSTGTHALKINSLILASISSQFNPLRIDSRQAAGSMAELTGTELHEATAILKELALSGNITALQIIVCYHIGLPWDIGLDVPFASNVNGDWVAQLDVSTGLTKMDLSICLPGMAKGSVGHVPASPILVRPLPLFAAKLLFGVVASAPYAKCLRDLSEVTVRNTNLIPHVKPISDRLSIAKVIASRGTHAIECGLDRATASYVTADFSKNGRSKNYYLTFIPAEIWDGSARAFNDLGWGDPVPMPNGPMLAMGSCVTPDEATIMAIDRTLHDRVNDCRPGKKYTLKSIDKHTNAYALLCAHRTAFGSLGRAAETYEFFASDYFPDRPYALLVDKRVGPHHGQTPIPLPLSLKEQIRLWMAHLEIFDARLSKLGDPPNSSVRVRIRKILAGERVLLFFCVDAEHQVTEIGSADVKALLPENLRIKSDYGRHYLQNKLRVQTIPQGWIDSAARHYVDGTSLSLVTANARQMNWLIGVAKQIDEINLALKLFPVVGLGRGKSA